MVTLGTAGHIDHGKSSIVKALTSIDPDRLPEEKERGMTIDLGFAWFSLPSSEKVGLIDVPGHQHFVRNVIPGLTGIDAVMLIVAADDGWMPQTEEHLQIINLLGINRGLVVLNKIDLAEADWREMVKTDITAHLAGTSLDGAPIIEVSAKSGQGIDTLKSAIEKLARDIGQEDIKKPRLPIDRVFNIKGSGTVITGTLHHGALAVGDEVTILPKGLPAHVRGIESYKEHLNKAAPGSRVALNLSGVKKDELDRGDVIVAQGTETLLSTYLDADLRLLPTVKQSLKTGAEVTLFFETAEMPARVITLEGKEIRPGFPALVQLRLDHEVATLIGERFILRKSSPAETIGGGRILDPLAERYQMKNARQQIESLNARRKLDLDSLITTELSKTNFAFRLGFLHQSSYSELSISNAIDGLANKGDILRRGDWLVGGGFWAGQQRRLFDVLAAEHKAEPLKKGLAQAEAAAKLALPAPLFAALVDDLIGQNKILRSEDIMALSSHKPMLSSSQAEIERRVIEAIENNPTTPPTRTELLQKLPETSKVLRYLLEQSRVIELPDGLLLTPDQYRTTRQKVIDILKSKGQIAIQDMAAVTGFSRKYSIPFLTRLDQEGITKRQDNIRIPARKLE